MTFLFKITIVVLLLFGIRNYTNYFMTDQVPEINSEQSTLSDINISDLKSSISKQLKTTKKEKPVTVKETYLYKWRDTKGIIHYTSEKPLEDVNVVPSVSENNTETQSAPTQHAELPSTNFPKNIYSPEGIKHLFEQAKSVQSLMDKQFSQQENSVNEN